MYSYRTGIPQIDDVNGGFDAGTNLLILAPPISSAESLAYALARPQEGEYTVILSTNERAAEVVDAFRASGADKRFVGVIDAITRSSTPNITDTKRLMFVSSPTDLTGIGIKFSAMTETIFAGEFSEGEPGLFPPPIRFCANSVSTLLMYRKLDVLYQFLHVLTARLKKVEGLGIFLLNSESFDEKTLAMIQQLVNCVIEVKVEQDGSYLRFRGIPGVRTDWQKYTISRGSVTIHP